MRPTEKKTFVADLREGLLVEDLFLVARKTLAETRAGKPYLALTLMDRTGEIEARVWENAGRYDAAAEVGGVIFLQGMARSFRDQLQLNITSLQAADSSRIDLEDFMPSSPRDRGEMVAELHSWIDTIRDQGLAELLRTIFAGEILESFSRAPAAKKMHHGYLGGLLEHTLSVVSLADRLADHYPGLDRDLLLTGALVHDLAKIREFSFTALPFDYTSPGRLLGHLVLGVEMVREAARNVSGLGEERLDQVAHLILSHHGRHEFGSPVLPMTQEALVLHHIDDMDAKMNYTDQLREKIQEPGYHWSDYQRPLERFLYLRAAEDGTGRQEQDPSPPARREPGRKTAARKHDPLRQQRLF